MSLLHVVRNAVKIADRITKPLHATVIYKRQLQNGDDGYGTISHSGGVPLKAVVDFARKQVRTRDGILTVTRATIDLVDINALVAATGGNGIGNEDIFILPDGDTGPILDISGFIDAGTGIPVATTVMIG